MKHILVSAFAALALLACAPSGDAPATPETPAAEPAPEPAPSSQLPPEDACNAGQYVNLIGRPADMPGVPEAGPLVRHIRPDTQVTMDYRPERLNIDISAEGDITGFRCG